MKILKYALLVALCISTHSVMGMNALRQKQNEVNRAKSDVNKVKLAPFVVQAFVQNLFEHLSEGQKQPEPGRSFNGPLLLDAARELTAVNQLIEKGTPPPANSLLRKAGNIEDYSQDSLKAIYKEIARVGATYSVQDNDQKIKDIKDEFSRISGGGGAVKKQEEKETSEPIQQERKTISEEAVQSNFISWQADADDKKNLSDIERTMFVLEHAHQMIKTLEVKLKDAMKNGLFEEFDKYSNLQKEYATQALQKMKSTSIDAKSTLIVRAIYRQFGRYFSYIQNPSEKSFNIDQEVRELFSDFKESSLDDNRKKGMVTALIEGVEDEKSPYSYLSSAHKALLQKKIACQSQNSLGAAGLPKNIYDLCFISDEEIQKKVTQELKQYVATCPQELDPKDKQQDLLRYVYPIIQNEPNEELKKMYAKACMKFLTTFSQRPPNVQGFALEIQGYFREIQALSKK